MLELLCSRDRIPQPLSWQSGGRRVKPASVGLKDGNKARGTQRVIANLAEGQLELESPRSQSSTRTTTPHWLLQTKLPCKQSFIWPCQQHSTIHSIQQQVSTVLELRKMLLPKNSSCKCQKMNLPSIACKTYFLPLNYDFSPIAYLGITTMRQ